jgi:hypothetical protein
MSKGRFIKISRKNETINHGIGIKFTSIGQ